MADNTKPPAFKKEPHNGKVSMYSQGSRHKFKERGEDLTIKHVPTGFQVKFPAFIDMFSDSYNSNWNAEQVYGRMDPIATFMNTRRALALSWNVPADSFEHAEENLNKVNQLMSFLYPLYDNSSVGGATVINQGPLLRISFGNLIKSAHGTGGLLGYVNGFTFDPDFSAGVFNRRPGMRSETASRDPQINQYYPKTFRLNFEFNVLHEHELGFKVTDTLREVVAYHGDYEYTGRFSRKYSFNDSRINFQNFPYQTPDAGIANGKSGLPSSFKARDILERPKSEPKKKVEPNSVATANANKKI